MAVVDTGKNPIGDQIKKKVLAPSLYGIRYYGAHEYGAGADFFGIYQVRNWGKHQVVVKEKLYVPTNPQTETQQANRQKMTDAVAAWQALTSSQQNQYNQRAKYKSYSGYNLYLREYLLSH